jgi:glycosyltransferase involved in cell wall biosynthesis/4-amino-4-deoxy-L-arabinose transferase-like glycosyltransferase
MTPLRIIMLSYERGFMDPTSDASVRLSKLASDDYRVSAIVLSGGLKKKTEERGSVRVSSVTGSAISRWFRAFWQTVAEVKRAKKAGESVVISAQDPFAAGNLAFYVSRLMGVPFEIQEHGDFFSGAWERELPVIHEVQAGKGKFIMRRADSIRVVSERIKGRLTRFGVTADRINVIPVAQDVSDLLQYESRAWQEVPTIVVPCRFVKQKGLDVLLKALAMVAKDHKFRVRLIGEGSEGPKLAELASTLGIRDRIEFEQWSSPEEIWKDADLFVMSSHYEGWGRTIVEAMAAGVPIVTTDVGCVGSFFRPQIDGRVVQVGDVPGLASAIREQLTEKDRREAMVASARERITDLVPAHELILKQRQAWLSATHDARRTTHRIWMITASIIAFSFLIHGISVAMFWKTLGPNREWGFFTLVQHWFQGYGYSFASQAGCVSAYRSPGFLFFLTMVYGLFGFANFFAQAIIQNLLAVLLTYLVYRLGWRITNDRRVGWVAAVLVTLHPYTFYHYTQYYHTVLSGVLLVSLLLSLFALDRTKKWGWAMWAGVMTAGLAYIQGTILPAMPFLAFWMMWKWARAGWSGGQAVGWSELKRSVVAVGIIAVTAVVLIAPWTYRNWKAFHKFVPLTTDLGHALAKANNENILGLTILGFPQEVQTSDRIINPTDSKQVKYVMLPEAQQALRDHDWLKSSGFFTEWHPREPGENWNTCDELPISEPDFNTYWTAYGMGWLKAHYWTEGWKLQLLKVTQFWSPFLQPSLKYGAQWTFAKNPLLDAAARWSLAGYVFLAELCAVLGIIVMKKRKQVMMIVPLLIPFVIYTVMHSFFAGYTKYRIPLDNLIVILAGIALVALWDMLRKKNV